jgi:spore coat polysaccharide biosynthesis protein SpsF
MDTLTVVQARMGSQRLPGKSMVEVYPGLSLLEMVLLRVKRSRLSALTVLATSRREDCDPLEHLAARLDVPTVRGDESDVLSRFCRAVSTYRPASIVRVCADNPLVSPEETDKLIDYFHRTPRLDYASNNRPESGLPDGLGCEIVRPEILLRLEEEHLEPESREHVTRAIVSNPERYETAILECDPELRFPQCRLDIDTPDDLERMRAFMKGLPAERAPYWSCREIVRRAKTFESRERTAAP